MKRLLLLFASLLFSLTTYSQYCTTNLYSSGCVFGDDIDDFTLGAFTHLNTGCTGTGAYNDYTSQTITVTQTLPQFLEVTSNFSSQTLKLFIDYNNDQDFDDPGEEFYVSPNTFGSGTILQDTLIFPSGSPVGTFRMRARVVYFSTTFSGCSSETFGEVHDYSLQIVPNTAGNCPSFTNVNVDSVATDAALINWSIGTGNTSYKVEYGLAGFSQGNGAVVTGTYPGAPPVLLSGLTPDKDYDFYITEYCSTNDSVYLQAAQSFRTLPVCPAVDSINIIALDSNSVTFTYWATTDSVIYQWGPAGFMQGTGTIDSTFNDTVVIGGLTPNTAYDFFVTSDCSQRGDSLSRVTGPISFTTTCGYEHSRYIQDFEASSFPCLSAHIDAASGSPTVAITTGGSPTSGVQQAFMSNSSASSTDDIILIGPAFWGITNLDKQVLFNAKTTSTLNTTLELVSIPDILNPGVYNVISSVTLGQGNQQFTINLDAASGYNGNDAYLGLRHGSQSTFQTIYIDDFIYQTIPTCPSINPFSVVAEDQGTDVFVYWDGNGSAGSQVEWGAVGFTPGAGAGMLTVTDTFATITGLTPNTVYEIYVRDSCSTTDFGYWTGPYTVLTGCTPPNAATLPFSDGFENYTTGPSFSDAVNFCNSTYYWSYRQENGTGRMRLQAGTAFYHGGVQAATLDHSPSATSTQSNFLTLTINLSNYSSAGGVELGFMVMNHGQEADPDNRVWVRGAPSDDWIEILNLNTVSTSAGVWDTVRGVDIKGPLVNAGQSLGAETQIRFGQNGRFAASSISFSDGYTFDDVSLQAVSCPTPANLSTSSLADTGATLNWAANLNGSSSQIWFGPVSFFQGTQTNGGVRAIASSNSYVLDTLSPNTCYEFLVRYICGSGDTSGWAGPIEFCTPCTPYTAAYSEDWNTVPSGTTGDFGNCWTGTTTSSGFSSYNWTTNTGTTGSSATGPTGDDSPGGTGVYVYTEASLGSAGDVATLISPPVDVSGLANPEFRFSYHMYGSNIDTLFIDVYNGSNWMQAVSQINLQQQSAESDSYRTHYVDLAPYSSSGIVQVRFRMRSRGCCAGDAALDNMVFDEAVTCKPPLNLGITTVDSMSATVFWENANTVLNSFELEYGTGVQGSSSNNSLIVSNDTATLSSLTPDMDYCYWVREICTVGDTSAWSGPYCFKTSCLAISAPYHENWDGLTAGNDLGCFSSIEDPALASSTFLGVTITNSVGNNPFSPPNQVEMDNSNVLSPLMLISPATNDMTAGDKRVRFLARDFSSTAMVMVGTMANPLDAATFHPLDTFNLSSAVPSTEYYSEITTANGYNGSDQYFAFAHMNNSSFITFFIDDVFYEEIPACNKPSASDLSVVGATTATVYWTPAAVTSGNWVVEYGPCGFVPGSGTMVASSNDTLTLTGLTPSTNYGVRIAQICPGGADTSLYTYEICFTTNCLPLTTPYAENFDGSSWVPDNVSSIAENSVIGNCWNRDPDLADFGTFSWRVRSAPTASGATGPPGDFTGGNYVYSEVSAGSSGAEAALLSPLIVLGGSNPQLSYMYYMYGSVVDDLKVEINNGSGNWTVLSTLTGQQQTSASAPWLGDTISLSAYVGDTVQLRWVSGSNGCCAGDIAIDDVFIGDPPSCFKPSSVTSSALSTSSAVLDWDTAGSGAASFEIEFGPAGFTIGQGIRVTATANTYSLTGLAQNICGEAYIRSICGPGDTSLWSNKVTVCPEVDICVDSMEQYQLGLLQGQSALFVGWYQTNSLNAAISSTQAHSGSKSLYIPGDGQSDVVAYFDTIDSGIWNFKFEVYVPSGTEGYYNFQRNYTHGDPTQTNVWAFDVFMLSNGTARVDGGSYGGANVATFSYTPGQWNTFEHIIDFDNDSVAVWVNGQPTGASWMYSFGNTLSVPVQCNGINFYSNGAMTNPDYYVDDFCIAPFIPSGCPAPSGLASSAAGCDSAVISWTAGTGAGSILEYDTTGFARGNGTLTGIVSSPFTLTGLSPGTTYQVYVADTCNGDTSNFSGPISFSTAPAVVASFGYTAGAPSATKRRITFNASASAGGTSYSWDFGDGQTGSGVSPFHDYVSNGSYLVTLVVTGACGTDTISDSVVVEGISLIETALGRSMQIYPNPADAEVKVEFDTDGSTTALLKLLDLSGKVVMRELLESDTGKYEHKLDLRMLPKGSYMIRVETGKDIATRSLVRQ